MAQNEIRIRPMSGRIDRNTNKLTKQEVDANADNELQRILDGIITEESLIQATGEDDLTVVQRLQLQVNTSFQSLLDLNHLLPSLRHLILDTSIISSVRDLGVGLRNLTNLSLNDCGLNDIDGISVLANLVELSACDNSIADVSPLAMHDNIQILNLCGNKLFDISIGDALSSCPLLRRLDLSRNPITRAPHYRMVMASLISSLEELDGSAVDPNASSNVSNVMVLEAASAMHMVSEEMDDERRFEMSIMGATEPLSYMSVGTSIFADHGSLVGGSGMGHSCSAIDFGVMAPIVATSSSSSSQHSPNHSMHAHSIIPDTGSLLTHGSTVVLAGNMAAAMRQRKRKEGLQAAAGSGRRGDKNNSRNFEPLSSHFIPVRPGELDDCDDDDDDEVVSGRDGALQRCTDDDATDYDEDREHSALAVLDSAIALEGKKGNNNSSNNNNSDANQSSSSRNSSRPGSSGGNVLSEESPGGPESSNKSTNARTFSFLGEGDITRSEAARGTAILHKDALLSLELQYGSNEPELDDDDDDDHGLRTTPAKIPLSRTQSGNSLNSAQLAGGTQQRLSREGSFNGSSSPRQRNGQRPVSAASYSSSNWSSDLDSMGGLTGRPVRAPSAAFKIAADGQNLEDARARMAAAKAKKTKGASGGSHRSRGVAFVDLMGEGGDNDGQQEKWSTTVTGSHSQPQTTVPSKVLAMPPKRKSKVYSDDEGSSSGEDFQRNWKAGKSIVHRDMVRRVHDNNGTEAVSPIVTVDSTCVVDIDNDNDDSDDDENSDGDIEGSRNKGGCTAVAHAERYRLMSASTSRTKSCNARPFTAGAIGRAMAAITSSSNSPGIAGSVRKDVQPQPSSSSSRTAKHNATVRTNEDDVVSDPRQTNTTVSKRKSGTTPTSKGNTENTASTMAGVSLGFDLRGSLAAISNWVDEMDSDDEEKDDDDDEEDEILVVDSRRLGPRIGKRDANSTTPNGTNIRKNGAGEDSLVRPSSGNSHSSNSMVSTTAGAFSSPKILSKDAILHMCSSSSSSEATGVITTMSNDVDGLPASGATTSKVSVTMMSTEKNKPGNVNVKTPLSSGVVAPLVAVEDVSHKTPVRTSKNGRNSSPHAPPTMPTSSNFSPKSRGSSQYRERASSPQDTGILGLDASPQDNSSMARMYQGPRYDDVVDVSTSLERFRSQPIPSSLRSSAVDDTTGNSSSSSNVVVDNGTPGPAWSAGVVGTSSSFVAGGDWKGGSAIAGEAVFRSDEELIQLLSRPPKTVPALRTKSSFQDFFRGMRSDRMKSLLEKSCAMIADTSSENQALKVKKRMELLQEVLIE